MSNNDTGTTMMTSFHPIDLDEFEENIRNAESGITHLPTNQFPTGHGDAVLYPTPPIPDYVDHRQGIDEIGRLSAEGVIAKFEATAKEVEAMGAELQEAAKRCEELLSDMGAALNVVREAAAQCRDIGKLVFLRIEDASLLCSEVKDTCTALKEKIAAPATS